MKKCTAFFIICLCSCLSLRAQTRNDLESAARIFDLQFTPQELDTLYSDVVDNVANYKAMHRLSLPNQVPLSLWQNPVLPGMQLNKIQKPILWPEEKVKRPAQLKDLAFYSVGQLGYLLKTRQVTSLELTQLFIQRIQEFGPQLQEIQEDAYVYQRLREAGAVLVAKFTLGALAMGDYWYGGRTKNPWNLAYGSSGSSAGSASATVAGLVPFAIGTETWGSIVSPSTTCGATGLRPTFGRVSRSGAMALSYSLDKIGPICRSATDAALVFQAIHGTDGKDLAAVQLPFNYSASQPIKKLKIGYAKNYFDKITDTTRNEWKVLQAFKKSGVELIPVDFPDEKVYPVNLMDIIIGAECAAQFDDLTRLNIDDQLTRQGKNDWPNQFRTSRFTPAVEYINAQRHRYLLMQGVNEVMSKFDAIICPSRGGGNQSAITNLTGHPVVCVPTGFDAKSNLPTGISFVGNLYDEGTILRIAAYYQAMTPHEEKHPQWLVAQ